MKMHAKTDRPLCVTTTACRGLVAEAELFADESVRLYLNCEYVGSAERDGAGRIENIDEDAAELIDEQALCELESQLLERHPCQQST